MKDTTGTTTETPSGAAEIDEPEAAGNGEPEATGEEIEVAPKPLQPVPFNPDRMDDLFRYAKFVAQSSLVPTALQGKPYNVLLVLLKGKELDLQPMQAIGNINVIEGKAEVGAHLIVALILRSPECEYFYLDEAQDAGEGDDIFATYVTRRAGWPEGKEQRATWSVARAVAARLGNKDNWKYHPLSMCKRRSSSELGRDVYPDIVMGMYDHGELSEVIDIDPETGAARVVIDPAAQAATPASSVTARVRDKAQGFTPKDIAIVEEPVPAVGRKRGVVTGADEPPADAEPDWMDVSEDDAPPAIEDEGDMDGGEVQCPKCLEDTKYSSKAELQDGQRTSCGHGTIFVEGIDEWVHVVVDKPLEDDSGNDCERCAEYLGHAGQDQSAKCGLCGRVVAVIDNQLLPRDMKAETLTTKWNSATKKLQKAIKKQLVGFGEPAAEEPDGDA